MTDDTLEHVGDREAMRKRDEEQIGTMGKGVDRCVTAVNGVYHRDLTYESVDRKMLEVRGER